MSVLWQNRAIFRFAGILALAGLFGGLAGLPARAFDPLGWFSSSKAAPVPSATALPYALTVEGADAAGLRDAVEEASLLHRLRGEPPVDGAELVRRADADLGRLSDALWGLGYYAARVSIAVEGVSTGPEGLDAAAARAEARRGTALVDVTIRLDPGPLYRFGTIRVLRRDGGVWGDAEVPKRLYDALGGEAARTDTLAAAARRVVDHLRSQGHPKARIADPEPVITHPAQRVDLDLVLEAGPVARLGTVRISGAEGIAPEVIRSHLYLDDSVIYSPARIAEMRRSIGRIEAVGSVRIREAERLASDGSLPLDVIITERPKRLLGGSIGYSTVDGPALRAYWAHRNLFGGAERLRLDGDLAYITGARQRLGSRGGFDQRHLAGRVAASFVKPAIAGTQTDFLADLAIERRSTRAYTNRLATAMAGFRYRFADKAWVQAGLEGEVGQVSDAFGRMDYRLLSLPMSGFWDTTDHDLDPRRGFRLSATVAPALGFGDAARGMLMSRVQASAYYPLDEAGRYVIAGRVAVGSILGSAIGRIPGNRRFFSGGGGSVRGYEYRSLGPRDAATGQLIGGRSLFEAALELRVRLTESIGIVPFIDVGTAFRSSLPDFSETLRIGVGLGLRYHTAIGPIRLDVATPLDRRKGEKPYAVYISLGQAF